MGESLTWLLITRGSGWRGAHISRSAQLRQAQATQERLRYTNVNLRRRQYSRWNLTPLGSIGILPLTSSRQYSMHRSCFKHDLDLDLFLYYISSFLSASDVGDDRQSADANRPESAGGFLSSKRDERCPRLFSTSIVPDRRVCPRHSGECEDVMNPDRAALQLTSLCCVQ